MTDLPNCPCGQNDWQGSGGAFGGGRRQYSRTCGRCGSVLQYMDRGGWTVAIIADPQDQQKVVDLLNTSMAIQSRAYEAEWKPEVERVRMERFKAFCHLFGADPDRVALGRVRNPKLAMALQAMEESPARPRPSLVRAPDVIGVPAHWSVFVLRGEGWDPNETDALAVLPADPLRAQWDTYFEDVWSALRGQGIEISPKEIPNEYYKDHTRAEPWWSFRVRDVAFKVGPRSHVIQMSLESPTPIIVDDLEKAAEAASTTFFSTPAWEAAAMAEAHGIFEKGTEFCPLKVDAVFKRHEDNCETPGVVACTVHAHNRDALVKYIALAVGSVMS